MSGPPSAKLEVVERHPDRWTEFGGWLFKRRSSIPVPLALLLLFVPAGWSRWSLSPPQASIGIPVLLLGEAIRLWGVHHIGVISRTRSDRLGPLIDSGPFSLVRNPLYLGNILLWLGFTLAARLLWLVPVVLIVLVVEYHAIVRWEEQLLTARIGEPYRRYTRVVPRWLPRIAAPAQLSGAGAFSWRETFYSERGTLIAIVVGFGLLFAKNRVWP
jgi:protein-S-isoprenylcysteine O-methyltransferase Ste14